jgi:hypothetical protein
MPVAAAGAGSYLSAMRRYSLPVLLALAALTLPMALPMAEARAQQRLGGFQSWTAATHTEGGQKVCYAFARASKSEGVPNRQANNVMLVVTHRPQGRDQVALQAGYTYPRTPDGAADPVQVTVGGPALGFFTAGGSAFARNGGGAIAALRNGREAVARGPGPNGRGQASDTFPLAGFSAAYEAISKACPANGGARR